MFPQNTIWARAVGKCDKGLHQFLPLAILNAHVHFQIDWAIREKCSIFFGFSTFPNILWMCTFLTFQIDWATHPGERKDCI